MTRFTALVGAIALAAVFGRPEPAPPPFTHPSSPVWEVPALVLSHPVDAVFEMNARLLASLALAEDPEAPTAVMWTVMNRTHQCECSILTAVVTGEAYGTRKRWTSDGPVEWRPSWGHKWRSRYSLRRLDKLEELAYAVMLGRRADPTGGATHFHRMGTWEPPWAPPRAARMIFGSHYFYRDLFPVGTV